jgi:hypothetical protein
VLDDEFAEIINAQLENLCEYAVKILIKGRKYACSFCDMQDFKSVDEVSKNVHFFNGNIFIFFLLLGETTLSRNP